MYFWSLQFVVKVEHATQIVLYSHLYSTFSFSLCWTLSKPLPSTPPESPRFPKQGKRLWNSARREHAVRLKTLLSVGVCGLSCRPSCTPDVNFVKIVLRRLVFELCPPLKKKKKTSVKIEHSLNPAFKLLKWKSCTYLIKRQYEILSVRHDKMKVIYKRNIKQYENDILK